MCRTTNYLKIVFYQFVFYIYVKKIYNFFRNKITINIIINLSLKTRVQSTIFKITSKHVIVEKLVKLLLSISIPFIGLNIVYYFYFFIIKSVNIIRMV